MEEQKALFRSGNNLVIEIEHCAVSEILEEEIDGIVQKFDEMETSQRVSSRKPSEGKGPQVLVLGGSDNNISNSSIFLLDYNGKIWNKVSIELPQKLFGHGTVILEDELYIIGGWISGNGCSRNLHRLNKKMEWEKLADMQEGRTCITNSCISHNGCIWVIGGSNGEWRERSNAAVAKRIRASSFFPRDQVVVLKIEKYDPATNTWEQKPAMKRGRCDAAAAVINDRIYVCGGDGNGFLDSVEVFDISSEVWTDFCTMPQPRVGMSIVVDGTSFVFIGGDYDKTVWKMDVEGIDKKWIDLPPLNEVLFFSSAVRIETGCILVFGGFKNQLSSSVDLFSGQKWESFPPLPQKRAYHTSVVLTPAMIDAFRPYILPVEYPYSCTIS